MPVIANPDKYLNGMAFGLADAVAWSSRYVSRLGGQPAVMLTISLDPRSSWANGILENSRYAKLVIYCEEGVIANFSGSLPKMRKARAKSEEDVLRKINAWIEKISAPVN